MSNVVPITRVTKKDPPSFIAVARSLTYQESMALRAFARFGDRHGNTVCVSASRSVLDEALAICGSHSRVRAWKAMRV